MSPFGAGRTVGNGSPAGNFSGVTKRGRRLLVLDIGGVVMRDPIPGLLDRIGSQSPTRSREEVWARYFELHLDLWSGRLGESAFWDSMLEHAGLEERRDEFRSYVIDGIEPIPSVTPRLEVWSKEVEVWALTNHLRAWLEPALAKQDMSGLFDRLLISDATGQVKPDTAADVAKCAAFSGLVDRWGAEPNTILYVDDKQVNIDAASRCGIVGLVADPDCRWLVSVDRWIADAGT